MAGIVQKLGVYDIGEVVAPGATVAEVVPSSATAIIEARVGPEYARGIRPGLAANVRLSAFDVSRYGSIRGVVIEVSPDAARDERTGQTFLRVRIRTDVTTIGGELIRPGLKADVSIIEGQRTVLAYFVEPLYRWALVAMQER